MCTIGRPGEPATADGRRAAARRTGRRARHRHEGRPLVGAVAAVDEPDRRLQAREVRLDGGRQPIGQPRRAGGLTAWRDRVHAQLANRRLLFDVRERDRAAAHRLREPVERPLLPLRTFEDRRVGRERSERRSRYLDLVPRLVRQDEADRLAGQRVAVPVGQLEVVVASGKPRPVVDAGPGGLADAVVGLPPPALQIVGVVNLDLSDAHARPFERRRRVAGAIPAVAIPPLVAPLRRVQAAPDRRHALRRVPGRQRGHVLVRKHPVVDAQLVEVSAAHEVVGALHLVRADDALVRAELVERGVEDGRAVAPGGPSSVHVEPDALRFVPRQGEVHPLAGTRERWHLVGHAGAGQAGVGHERVEPGLAVVVDAQPHHVPAGMVGVAHAEQREGRRPDGFPRPPEERQGAALGVDVPRGPVRQQLRMGALQARPLRAAGNNLHPAREVRLRIAAGRDVSREPAAARQVEEQTGVLRGLALRGGHQQRRHAERDAGAAPHDRLHDPASHRRWTHAVLTPSVRRAISRPAGLQG